MLRASRHEPRRTVCKAAVQCHRGRPKPVPCQLRQLHLRARPQLLRLAAVLAERPDRQSCELDTRLYSPGERPGLGAGLEEGGERVNGAVDGREGVGGWDDTDSPHGGIYVHSPTLTHNTSHSSSSCTRLVSRALLSTASSGSSVPDHCQPHYRPLQRIGSSRLHRLQGDVCARIRSHRRFAAFAAAVLSGIIVGTCLASSADRAMSRAEAEGSSPGDSGARGLGEIAGRRERRAD